MNSDEQNKHTRLRIVADRSRCCGYGLCAAICPQIYKIDEGGLVFLESEFVSQEFETEAREGAAACPAEALLIEPVTG